MSWDGKINRAIAALKRIGPNGVPRVLAYAIDSVEPNIAEAIGSLTAVQGV
jgi:hypothetical protein